MRTQPSTIQTLKSSAHWVARQILVWDIPGSPKLNYCLHFDPDCALQLSKSGITGGQTLPLSFTAFGPGQPVLEKFPHLAGFTTLRLDPEHAAQVPNLLKYQIAVSAHDQVGDLIGASTLQIPGVLDDLYNYSGPLGITFEDGLPVLRLWAPTARSVTLLLFPDSSPNISYDASYASQPQRIAMTNEPDSGVWAARGEAGWIWKYYLYEVEVYVPDLAAVVRNQVTDPYSISLSMNSTRSQIIDLADPPLLPGDWQAVVKPPLEAPEDIVLYELHVRDFSIFDLSVPPAHRGKFLAFTDLDSHGMQHLKTLAQAGLTHLHLLPVFDIATIEENPAKRREPDPAKLASFPGDSQEQQALISKYKDKDGFNWGYDPYHYTTPEGSYSTDPDSPARILEFRQMVQSLNSIGLRVVMDVVYNHTYASGQAEKSVLDKIVPGYYHRLDAAGLVETSTCCANTATEHVMMEKLMIDSLLTWARAYRVDGFRFDLMGHHMLTNMHHVRQALDALTLANDGVDGKKIVLYGEGWNFGEVANNARGRNATQMNIAGMGIGVFNDRLRDAARGGSPFSFLTDQGFITGLYDDPNASNQGTPDEQKARLLHTMDWLRLSMAGNLKDYRLQRDDGWRARGVEINYNGSSAAFTSDPQENVVYLSAHDNHTLFDSVQMKAPISADLRQRVRMHNLGIDVLMLIQGVPFFQAGDDLLRSKSLDNNSYNSGDWFNRLDFTCETNNWAVGLPPNQQTGWPFMQPLLANRALKPSHTEIFFAAAHFQEMLKIRKSSPLFRLRTADQILQRVKFYNTGPCQTPSMLVMCISNPDLDLDPQFAMIAVFINASKASITFCEASLRGNAFRIHPVQAASYDPLVHSAVFDSSSGAFTIPARTTAVFVSSLE
jgi:pullulanase-type alpha-1,6-glucosidase